MSDTFGFQSDISGDILGLQMYKVARRAAHEGRLLYGLTGEDPEAYVDDACQAAMDALEVKMWSVPDWGNEP